MKWLYWLLDPGFMTSISNVITILIFRSCCNLKGYGDHVCSQFTIFSWLLFRTRKGKYGGSLQARTVLCLVFVFAFVLLVSEMFHNCFFVSAALPGGHSLSSRIRKCVVYESRREQTYCDGPRKWPQRFVLSFR